MEGKDRSRINIIEHRLQCSNTTDLQVSHADNEVIRPFIYRIMGRPVCIDEYMLRGRRAAGTLMACIFLIISGVIVALLVTSWNASIVLGGGPSYHVVIDSVTFSYPSVENAKWELALMVRNDGRSNVLVTNLYVNRELVDEYGLVPGGSLSSKSVIGTSLPSDGVVIGPNDRLTISIWIGSDLFSSGNQISIHIQNPNILEYTRYVILK